MAKRKIVLEYEFTSAFADGDNYTLRIDVRAENEKAALNMARIVGFEWFGAKFNDNCVDWRVVQQ